MALFNEFFHVHLPKKIEKLFCVDSFLYIVNKTGSCEEWFFKYVVRLLFGIYDQDFFANQQKAPPNYSLCL